MRLINGKTFEDIERELSEPLEGIVKERIDNGFSYLPVDLYRKRLNEVIGRLHYSVEFSNESVIQVGDEWELPVTCTITVYDDDGKVVCSKSERGGKTVIFPLMKDEKGKPIKDENGNKKYLAHPSDFANHYNGAASDAFKRTCLNGFGIGENIRELNKNNKGKNANSNNTEYSMETVRFLFLTPLTDRKNQKGDVVAQHCKVVNPDNVEVTFIIWKKKIVELQQRPGIGNKDLFSTLKEHLSSQFKAGKTVVPVNVMGYYNDYKGEKQFILNDINI